MRELNAIGVSLWEAFIEAKRRRRIAIRSQSPESLRSMAV